MPDISAPLDYRIDTEAFYHPDEISRVVRPQYQRAARFLIRTAAPKPEDFDADGNVSGRFFKDVETHLADRLVILKRFYGDFKRAVCAEERELSWNKFKKIMEEEGVIDIYLVEINGKKQGKINCYLLKPGKTIHDLAAAAWVAYQVYDQREVQKKSVEPLDKFVDPRDIPGYMSELLDKRNGTLLLFQMRRYRRPEYRALIEAARDLWPHAFTQVGAEGMRQLETKILEHYVARELDAITRDSDRKVKKQGVSIVEEVRARLEAKYGVALEFLVVNTNAAPMPTNNLDNRASREDTIEDDDEDDPDDDPLPRRKDHGEDGEDDEDDDDLQDDKEDEDDAGDSDVGAMTAEEIVAELRRTEEEGERRKRIQARAEQEAFRRGGKRR